jgi:acetyl esterase
MARRTKREVSITRNVSYGEGGKEHLLDVYSPKDAQGPCPVVLYVHGGGFRILSKDTHWMMGLAFASRGYIVFNINYRLAPKHPYPAAFEDVCQAVTWVQENAAEYGGDASRLLLAGESAGANLITALTIACTYRRDEPWAQKIFESQMMPLAVMPACGMFQVSDPERIKRRKPKLKNWVADRIEQVSTSYLGKGLGEIRSGDFGLADPVIVLEGREKPERELPPFFLSCGTRDPILDDTRRLGAALQRHGTDVEMKFYEGAGHAFHALLWKDDARLCWRDHFEFLEGRVG